MTAPTDTPSAMPSTPPDLDLAVLHHLRGDLEGAEAGYRAVLAASPDNATALNNLGFAAAQSGRFDEARELYERSLAIEEGATARLNLGNVRAALGDLESAIAELSRATELAPHDPTAFDNLGQLLLLQGRIPEAEAAWRQALAIEDGPRLRTALATAVAATGRLGEAAGLLHQALTLDPQFGAAWAQLGAVLLLRGDVASAGEALANAKRLDPDDPGPRRHLALALLSLGRTDEAVVEFGELVRLAPDDATSRVDLAVLHLSAGRAAAALTQLDRALEAAPDDDRARLHRAFALRELGRITEADELLSAIADGGGEQADRARQALADETS
ncbi:tetratricopeptide repeat protein [Kitasatospora acidiphila]|uniref:tetratricopeptide repeat protein n=1 Tax=Kitasatospora acidiphila TaxID=2567942 RepID=UPI003C71FB2D